MTALLVAVPGLTLVGAVVLLVAGMRLMRADPVDGLQVGDLVLLRDVQRRRAEGDGPLQRLARPLVGPVKHLMGERLRARLARMIELAGRPDGLDLDAVVLRMAMWLIVMAPLAVLLALRGAWWGGPLAAVVVVVLPLARVARARRLRQETIDRDLPDFLDVLAVTVTAGVGFRSALQTVADRFGGPLGQEVSLTLAQVRNGASVREAFLRLRGRNDSEPLSSFVTAYLQSEELGAPLAVTLNRIAEDVRRDSAQRQRQHAARVAPRVTLVTSVVLVPGALVLLVVGFALGIDFDVEGLLGGGL